MHVTELCREGKFSRAMVSVPEPTADPAERYGHLVYPRQRRANVLLQVAVKVVPPDSRHQVVLIVRFLQQVK